MCRTHASEQRRANRSVNNAFYASKAWRITRSHHLFERPLCEYVEGDTTCGMIADSVHHILPIEEGGDSRSSANLLSVCRRHHTMIHAQRRGRETA
jgi:hypothetical protein